MNDNQFSLAGNIVRDPVLKRVRDNSVVATFRIASTPRRYDPSIGDWRNMDSLFLTVNCWNRLAERVAGCLKGGDPVVISGRLRMHSYEVEGDKRTVYELDAQHVSPDLNRVAVDVQRVSRHLSEAVPDGERDLVGLPASMPAPMAASVANPMPASVSTGPLVPMQAEPAA